MRSEPTGQPSRLRQTVSLQRTRAPSSFFSLVAGPLQRALRPPFSRRKEGQERQTVTRAKYLIFFPLLAAIYFLRFAIHFSFLS